MSNLRIAEIFEKMADILEVQDANPFRVRAYRRAARTIEGLGREAAGIAAEGALSELSGIGEDLASKINEFLATGKISAYEGLKKRVKPVLLDMMDIPGIGPKTAKLLSDKLKVKSLDDLEKKAKTHKIAGLPGLKEKTEENILKGLRFLKKDSGRMPIDTAFTAAAGIIAGLKRHPEVIDISPAGSLRRMKETVRDVDILVTSKNGGKVIEAFTGLPEIASVSARGETKSSVVTKDNVRVDLRVVPPESYGAALMYFTGSKEHNIAMREMARKKGLKINEYGVFRKRGNRKIAGKSEDEIYSLFKMPYVEPELRENTGEIDAALRGRLPRLLSVDDIRGDFHIHTKASDGVLSISEIAALAKKRGYEYALISDHSASLKIAGGLGEKRMLRQIETVRRFNARYTGIEILIGSEVDILDNGDMDYSDEILKKLDFVIAAIHSGFKQTKEKLTSRIIKAMHNRYVNTIAHPSGRLIGQRDAYDLDYEKIFAAAKKTKTALEINACPERLDLTDINARRAREAGVKLGIATDTHTKHQMDNMIYGVSVARRGWCGKKDVLNCLGLKELKRFVQEKRNGKNID